MRRSKKLSQLNNQVLEYALPNMDVHFRSNGTFIAVKLIEHFLLNALREDNTLAFSNQYLAGKFYCTVSGLQDAFKILEKDGIVYRTFHDETKHKRSEFQIDIEKSIQWLSVTIYDQEYKTAPKRSLFKAFVNQSVLFIKNKAKTIRKELQKLQYRNNSKIRRDKVESLNQKLDNKYDRYIKHLQNRLNVQFDKKERKKISELTKEASYAIRDVLMSWGFNPPDLVTN